MQQIIFKFKISCLHLWIQTDYTCVKQSVKKGFWNASYFGNWVYIFSALGIVTLIFVQVQ